MLREQLIDRLILWQNSTPQDLEEYKRIGRLLGRDYRALGMWDDAWQVFHQVLRACANSGDQPGVAEFTIWISNLCYHKGEYQRAIRHAARGIALRRHIQGRLAAADTAAYYLGKPLLVLDRLPQHRRVITQAIRAHGEKPAEHSALRLPWLYTYLGENYRESGLLDEASALLERQILAFRALEEKTGLALALLQSGLTLIELGKANEAVRRLEEGLGLFGDLQREGFVCDCLVALSRAKALVGDQNSAISDIDEALRLAYSGPIGTEGLADTLHLNVALIYSAQVRALVGDHSRATADRRRASFLAASYRRELLLRHLREAGCSL